MPDKLPEFDELTLPGTDIPADARLPGDSWLPILRRACDFPPAIFDSVSLNLIKNPNINSSLLFRADILYDSLNEELTEAPLSQKERHDALEEYNVKPDEYPGFEIKRTFIRRMIPRNPQLDKPISQTCVLLKSKKFVDSLEATMTIYIPHCREADHLPWYHPRVKKLAYLHAWPSSLTSTKDAQGVISLHYDLFSEQSLPLSDRLARTGKHLLSALFKHGQGLLTGYTKKVHHDQLISQQRVQDRYTELKKRYAKRLCDNWVEQTEPSKHVFEDLGIAAFLIELWKDMYPSSAKSRIEGEKAIEEPSHFPGFVDVGCGNGVLVDVLLREGYDGWGFDARKRKTWSTFSEHVRSHLEERLLIPQPFFEMSRSDEGLFGHSNASILSLLPQKSDQPTGAKAKRSVQHHDRLAWHNGIFPKHTFIISNHADELTPWTPLLAFVSESPFLAIPCCSHNLSGSRFRAPSVFNNYSADTQAPSYFAASVNKSKSVAIVVASPETNYGIQDEDKEFDGAATWHSTDSEKTLTGPEQGDLKNLSPTARSKQPSAYSSLCDWVTHLATQVGYEVEREFLRLPSTRNIGLICRTSSNILANNTTEEKMNYVLEIARQEKADGALWVGRAKGLMGGTSGGGEH